MRAFIISIALLVSVVCCIAFLVLVAGVSPSAALLVSLALGLFMMAVLFAAISAIGPKFRPTPLLTPMMAGTVVAGLITVLISVGNQQYSREPRAASGFADPPATSDLGRTQPPVVTISPAAPIAAEPETRTVRAVGPTPADAADETEPVVPPPPAVTSAPADDGAATPPTDPSAAVVSSPSAPASVDTATTTSAPLPSVLAPANTPAPPTAAPTAVIAPLPSAPAPAQDPAATSPEGPLVLVPVDLLNNDAATPAAAADSSPSDPPVPLAPSAPLVLSTDSFDTSITNADSPAPTTPTPPLPRSRPCGVGGLPCP